MNRHLIAGTSLVVALLATVASCSTETPTAPATVTVTPTVEVTNGAPSTVTSTDSPTMQQGDGQMGDATTADRTAALKAANAFAAVWVQGQTLPQDTWLKQLMDTAAPGQGQDLLSTVLGTNVEATAIQGAPTIKEITPTSAVVLIQTNAEPLQITLTTIAAQTYKVSRIDIGTQ